MDYKQPDDLDPEWAEYSHGPRSDSQIYGNRMNPFDSLPPTSQAQASGPGRYSLGGPAFDTMAWTQQQSESHHSLVGSMSQARSSLLTSTVSVPYHGQIPPLNLTTEDEEAEFDLFDRPYPPSTLQSPAFDQTSFVSLSPQNTPGEVPSSSKSSSYFGSRTATDPLATTAARKKERAQHNVVEHRYREKLNSQISQLKEKVPSLRGETSSPPQGGKRGGKEPAKVGKSVILVKAGEYIDKLETENTRLRKRNESLERLVQRLVQGRAAGSDMADLRSA